jgi:hypothetical protein
MARGAPPKPHNLKAEREVAKLDKRRHKARKKEVREAAKTMLPRRGP